jgi:hypothetical protein
MDGMNAQARAGGPPLSALSYYRAHGAFSDPGPHAPAIIALPDDVGALAGVVRGLLIHMEWLHLYGMRPDDIPSVPRETLPVAQRLDAILSAEGGPLSQASPAARRAPATCRDYALMLCAFLRQKSIPARVRCGFARYFERGRNADHWICEYWKADDGRWALTDAQLDDEHRAHLRIGVDTLDLPEGQFVFAADAWRRCRASLATADSFGHGSAAGAWFLASTWCGISSLWASVRFRRGIPGGRCRPNGVDPGLLIRKQGTYAGSNSVVTPAKAGARIPEAGVYGPRLSPG